MAGFFEKLFNRITGKPAEEAAPVADETLALPAPEAEVVEPIAIEELVMPEEKPVKAEPKKAVVKKVEPKKVEAKKPEPKKIVQKKPEPKKPEPKKIEPKKPEQKKPEPTKTVGKKPSTAKPAPVEHVTAEPIIPTQIPIAVVPEPVAHEPTPPAPLPAIVVEAEAPASNRGGWFTRLKSGLSKSSQTITGSITSIFTKRKLDRETLQELEDTLIQADLGVTVSERIIAAVSQGRYDKEIDPEEVKSILAAEVAKVLKPVEVAFNFGAEKPFVIMVVGVNGSGKTTTIGKLGSIAAGEGFKVMFAACDTFRAAAIEQLTVWGNRIGATTMSAPQGADAAGLAFDAIKAAQGNGTDILFIDTAGRLQNKAYLMDELDKVVRVIKKLDPQAPHAVLLVLDATTGQNALAQAEIFTKVAGVTGLIMTKLDGTARGGILVAIAEKFKLPIHAIGVGESIADLQPFDAQGFARAIAGFDEE
jgi:fused signal recognition particle receptor